jgi:hypothetical protein
VTSYANAGGTGNRTSTITVTCDAVIGSFGGNYGNLVDGAFGNNDTDAVWWDYGQTGKRLTFQFATKKIIDEAKHYSSTAASHGTWKWQGSDDGSSWVDLSTTFTFQAGFEGFVQGDLSGNSTGYYYYSILQTGGVTNSNPWMQEWEFKIDDPPTIITGTLAGTDTPDTASMSGESVAAGVITATEPLDIALFGSDFISVVLAATDAKDVMVFAEVQLSQGTLAATDPQDTAAMSGGYRRRPFTVVLTVVN